MLIQAKCGGSELQNITDESQIAIESIVILKYFYNSTKKIYSI